MSTWQIQSTQEIALGNGTRNRGFVFGSLADDESFNAAMEAASMNEVEKVESLVQLAEDVELQEVINALRTVLMGGPVQVVCPESESDEEESDGNEKDPKTILVASLPLTDGVLKSLKEAGLVTLEDAIAFADLNEGFTSIEGIGKASEAKIVAEMKLALS